MSSESPFAVFALTVAFFFVCSLTSIFAQEEPEKIAVYVHGASEAGINKSLGNKLLLAITQSGEYAEIENLEAFRSELAKSPDAGTAQIAQIAKRYGADIVCAVSMTEVFGAYSITVRVIETSDAQIVQTASLDRSLKSVDDLTRASDELTAQLLGLAPPAAASKAPVAAAKKECEETYNINEIISKLQKGFPAQLKDCSVTLAKNMALAMSPFGKKTAMKDPVTFMKECTIDGLKQKVPGAEEYIKLVENFLQNILNAAVAASGGLDVRKLSGAIGSMNVNKLMNDLKNKAANDECMLDEPYEPDEFEDEDYYDDEEGDGEGRKIVSLGFRAGFNFSHLYADYQSDGIYDYDGSYNSIPGFQFGLVLDIAPSEVFHIQPGLMYIRKGTKDINDNLMTSHYIEIPLLISLKLSALRLNAGPYLGICLGTNTEKISCDSGSNYDSGYGYGYYDYGSTSSSVSLFDFGISTGFGFDIGMFYIGMFYDHGLVEFYDYESSYKFYNRTFGFNFGVNL
jgi:hypothetical protein